MSILSVPLVKGLKALQVMSSLRRNLGACSVLMATSKATKDVMDALDECIKVNLAREKLIDARMTPEMLKEFDEEYNNWIKANGFDKRNYTQFPTSIRSLFEGPKYREAKTDEEASCSKVPNKKADSSTQGGHVGKTVQWTPQPNVVTSATAEEDIPVSRDLSDTDKLSEDLFSLLRLSLYADAKLRCGDRTVPVHRCVLAARSRKFDALFRDLSKDTFDVTDLDEKTLYPLLEYAYTGTVRKLSDETAVSLYGAGQKYGMDSLRKACSDWMILHLTPENCVGFLEAVSSSDDGLLQEAVASFLCDHPDVLKSPDWIRFAEEHQSLAYKLLYAYALQISQTVESFLSY